MSRIDHIFLNFSYITNRNGISHPHKLFLKHAMAFSVLNVTSCDLSSTTDFITIYIKMQVDCCTSTYQPVDSYKQSEIVFDVRI